MSDHSKLKTARIACRVPLFSPNRETSTITTQRVTTPWGRAVITGKLDQRHRDVLDTLLQVAHLWLPDGSKGDYVARVDSARLRAALGWNKLNYEQIVNALRDLRAAEIEANFDGEKNMRAWAGIIGRIEESEETPPGRRVGTSIIKKSERNIAARDDGTKRTSQIVRGGRVWEVVVSGIWLDILRSAQTAYPAQVLRMRYGVSQAITRFMLSHSGPTEYGLEKALSYVGVPVKRHERALEEMARPGVKNKRSKTKAREEIPSDIEIMAGLGIAVDTVRKKITRVGRTTPVTDRTTPVPDRTTPVPIVL